MEVYLDNSATTKTFPDVADYMYQIMTQDYGNPASMHQKGVEAEKYIKEAKDIFAKLLKVNEKELFFTSGGTESDNWAVLGTASANHRAGKHIITTKIEHPAIGQVMTELSEQGYDITYLPVGKDGVIRLEDLKHAMRADTILVSIMHVNNEVGSVQPIEEIGALIKKMNPRTLFHVDGVQGFGKLRLYPKKAQVDLLSVSSHKVHGPKGVGLLYINEKVKIKPIIFGGGQQKGYRSGTENVPGVAGFALACKEIYKDLENEQEKLYSLRDYFIQKILKMDQVVLNGPQGREGAPHIVSLSFLGVRSEVLLHALEEKGIYVSAGSACASKKHTVSATLSAMGLGQDALDATLRFSFSIYTTKEELDYTLKALHEIVPMLRRYTRH